MAIYRSVTLTTPSGKIDWKAVGEGILGAGLGFMVADLVGDAVNKVGSITGATARLVDLLADAAVGGLGLYLLPDSWGATFALGAGAKLVLDAIESVLAVVVKKSYNVSSGIASSIMDAITHVTRPYSTIPAVGESEQKPAVSTAPVIQGYSTVPALPAAEESEQKQTQGYNLVPAAGAIPA